METLLITENTLHELRLYGIKNSFQGILKRMQQEELGYEVFLNLLLQEEKCHRDNKRIAGLRKRAAFKQDACLEGFDSLVPRGLSKGVIQDLNSCRFIKEGSNILLLGPTGVGKSYLATAIGNTACRKGYTVLFFRMNHLIEKLSLERAKATYLNFIKKVSAPDLLILDDFGIKPLSPQQFQDLYDIIDERGDNKAMIITSQIPPENWNEVIADPVTCEAITDRICARALKLSLTGDSYRPRLTRCDPS